MSRATALTLARVPGASVYWVNARMAVLLGSVFHATLIVSARYRLSYDAYNHMFFGDHYRRAWWSLWDERWYTGFAVNSYPPLIHQLIGGLSHLIGIDAAFGLLLWLTLSLLPLAIYSFARIFTGKASASYAALGAAFLPSVYLTAHIFGQLPTLAGAVTSLFAMAALRRFISEGGILNGVLTVSLLATVMAFHHATLLFLPWLVLAVVAHVVITGQTDWRTLARRLLPIGVLSVLAILIVIWPFWDWGRSQSLQTPIDHASRHNFFQDPRAALLFFLPMYGPLVLILPAAFGLARRRRLFGLALAFLVLSLLGLGGTTPLPRLFFGRGWEWLTYDRFAFWASLVLLPFFGMIMVLLRRRRVRWLRAKVFFVLAAFSLLVALLTSFLPLQPGAVQMREIVDFLERKENAGWRYVTFGFGDQLALLSTMTTATTIDGSYHTARSLPELRSSGIGQIDTAIWFPNGLEALDPILEKADDHGVRWGFVNVQRYVPVLKRNGWVKVQQLAGGVEVWENPDARPPAPSQSPPEVPLASFSWGTLPLLSLVTSVSLGSLRAWPLVTERVLRGLYAIVVGVLPIGLCFWYFRSIASFPHARVYYTYTDALFFLADALMLLAVIIWGATKIARYSDFPTRPPLLRGGILLPGILASALCLLSFISLLWSRDWRTSLFVAVHFSLVVIFVLSLREWSYLWKFVLPGFIAALSLQFLIGGMQIVTQSTAFLAPLQMQWPGPLDPSVRGAVIVQLPSGASFLRAYGTLPHPNILGGFTLITLLGPAALLLRKGRFNYIALPFLVAGVSLLAITFSRSAWLALVVFCAGLIWRSRNLARGRSLLLCAIIGLSFLCTLLPFRDLVAARTVNTTSHAEEFSFIGRSWLNGQARNVISEYPWTGVGIGSFIIELSRRAGFGYVVEPAHNIPLMAGAELGLPGLLLVFGITASLAYRWVRTRNPDAILIGAALAGLACIGLFDHYLWTLPPGRLMLGLVVGLFLGQDREHVQ